MGKVNQICAVRELVYRRIGQVRACQATDRTEILRTTEGVSLGKCGKDCGVHKGAIGQKLHSMLLTHIRHAVKWPRINQRELRSAKLALGMEG